MMRCRPQHTRACFFLALGVLTQTVETSAQPGQPGAALPRPGPSSSPPAPPPTEEELAAARALFGEALHDEEEGRVGPALEKFKRVRQVRDSASVEYRIGTCEEGLGHLLAASAAYAAAVELGRGSPQGEEVALGASNRLELISKRIAHLRLELPPNAPRGASVAIDGATATSLDDVAVDPGAHEVTGQAQGMLPFRSSVTAPEGGELRVAIAFTPASPPAPPPTNRVPGWATLGGGAALLAGSGVVLLLRASDISSLDQACPMGNCPPGSNQAQLESTRSRALAEGPVGVGLLAAGAVAAGVGLYLVLRPSSRGSPMGPNQTSGQIAIGCRGTGPALSGAF